MRLALTLACILVGCSSNNDDAAAGDANAALRTQCVDEINSYRATLGLPALAGWTEQGACSDQSAASDAQTKKPHGAFGKCTEAAQNECPGWPGPPETMIGNCLQMMWDEGPGTDFSKHGHYINMSSTKYTKVACGFAQATDGKWWSVQNFR